MRSARSPRRSAPTRRWPALLAPGVLATVSDGQPVRQVALTPPRSRRRWTRSRVEAWDVADDLFDLGDQRIRRRPLVVLAVDADRRGAVNVGGLNQSVHQRKVFATIDAVR